MCDELTAKEEQEYLARTGQLTRRQFGKLSAGGQRGGCDWKRRQCHYTGRRC